MPPARRKLLCWVVTAVLLLPMAASGIPELLGMAPAMSAAALVRLG